jgi:hypothetical protein
MGNVVKVRGLPFDCTRADVLYFFRDADPKENGIFFVSNIRSRRYRYAAAKLIEGWTRVE